VIDVSDPANPNEVGFFNTGGQASGVAVSGSYAYVADGSGGLRVIDVSDPVNPNEVGFFDTGDEALGVAISGSYAYVADDYCGLYILDCSRAPVMLQAFDASWMEGEVHITWEVSDETNVLSYNIYRARRGEAREFPALSIPATGLGRYEVTDSDALPGESYIYTLGALKKDGNEMLLGTREIKTGPPAALTLKQNIPNPFNPVTEIEVTLPKAMRVDLSVYDMQGHLVAKLYSGIESAGVKHYRWDGRDQSGNPVASGVYLYCLRAGKKVLSRKMVLIR